MDYSATVHSPLSGIAKQESVSFPVLGRNNIFDKARTELNKEYGNGKGKSQLPRVKNSVNNMLTEVRYKKIDEENKRNVEMMKLLHLIHTNRPVKNTVKRVEAIKKELNEIKSKIALPIDLTIQGRDRSNQPFKKVILTKRSHKGGIRYSPNKNCLTERGDNRINDSYVKLNKRFGVIDLMNHFDKKKALSRNDTTSNANHSHYNVYQSSKTNTISGSKGKFKRIFFNKERELEENGKRN